MSGRHVRWPVDRPVWEFDWRLGGRVVAGPGLQVHLTDTEGIVFSNVFFKNHSVLFKASLPMIRVQYDYLTVLGQTLTSGPFKDQLWSGNAILWSGALMPLVGVREREGIAQDGVRFLSVESGHTIGHYRLTNRWIFREDGTIQPQLFSAGLQFPADHRHHAYWRFDFDIDGADNNLALNKLQWWPQNWGFGAGWHPITVESSYKRPISSRFAILNKGTGRGYQVFAGPNDGEGDGFSADDFWVQRYHPDEDRHGDLGTPNDDQLLTLHTGENADGTDVVAWYCAHLSHEAHEGGDEWHVCGPILRPFGF